MCTTRSSSTVNVTTLTTWPSRRATTCASAPVWSGTSDAFESGPEEHHDLRRDHIATDADPPAPAAEIALSGHVGIEHFEQSLDVADRARGDEPLHDSTLL